VDCLACEGHCGGKIGMGWWDGLDGFICTTRRAGLVIAQYERSYCIPPS
jgi:hypothetical protein